MKPIKYILGLVVGCLFFSSCADELDSPYTKTDVVDGIPVTAVISYDVNNASIVSRATADEEDAVADLYVLIFNTDGTFVNSAYFTGSDLDDMGRNKIKLNTTTGEKKLYAVANTASNSFSLPEENLKDKIDEFLADEPTLNGWLEFSMAMTQEHVTWEGGHGTFTMSGYFVSDGDAGLEGDVLPGDGICTFNLDGTVTVAGKIQLVRVVSQITFNISDAGNSNGIFTPTSWAVYNVPNSVYMNRKDALGGPVSTTYFSRSGTFDQNSFNFYMLENRQEAIGSYSGSALGKLQMNWREAYSLGENQETKIYSHAPANGTYVVLQGNYKGNASNPFNDDIEGEAQATVTYYIHLGYADNVVDDFSIPRNAKYTYNVTVAGVDDIIVEVVKDDKSNPSDGHVMFYDAEMIEVDAHYERREITIDCRVDEFICGIETPMTGFVYKDIAELSASEKDIDWVHFMLKSKAEELNHLIQFPASGSKTEGLMNIEELTDYVKANTNDHIFYVYIDENYYKDLAYDKFVNFEKGVGDSKSRKMMIAVERNNKENSSVSSSKYIIQQKPITTIFNLENEDVSSGMPWGVEWVNENLSSVYYESSADWKTRAQAGIAKGRTTHLPTNGSADDGLTNTRSAIQSSGLNSVSNAWLHDDINYSSYPYSNQAQIYAACMSRNRDENGNGKIDGEEIKWYLPANNQLQYLWVGMPVIPEEATLYPKDFRDAKVWQFYHHASSDSKVLWAEEGCAIGSITASSASHVHIRCARNIGDGNQVLKIGTRSTIENDVIVEIGTRLPKDAFRQKLETGKFTIHNEYGTSNNVYGKIRIKKELLGTNQDFRTKANAVYDSESFTDPCATKNGSGWRSPSQRELILMTTIGELGSDAMHSVTYYSFWDYVNQRPISYNPSGSTLTYARVGFSYNGTELHLLTPSNNNGYGGGDRKIRCVKDIE